MTISIIGSGNMAAAIGTRAANHGYSVEIMSRNPAKSRALAEQLGNRATVGAYGTRPAGEIVIIAVLFAAAVEVVAHYGDALGGKILVDITNPFNADASGLITTEGNSIAQQLAVAAPEDTHVVKALNMLFRGVLVEDKPVDVFFAGDPEATAPVAAFLVSLGMRPRYAGGLDRTHVVEWGSVLLMGVAGNGAGFGIALSAEAV
jgi:predicted dinucleotide-binding enzyme